MLNGNNNHRDRRVNSVDIPNRLIVPASEKGDYTPRDKSIMEEVQRISNSRK